MSRSWLLTKWYYKYFNIINKIKRSSDCAPIFPRLKLPLQSLNLLPLVEPHWNYRLKTGPKAVIIQKAWAAHFPTRSAFTPSLYPINCSRNAICLSVYLNLRRKIHEWFCLSRFFPSSVLNFTDFDESPIRATKWPRGYHLTVFLWKIFQSVSFYHR